MIAGVLELQMQCDIARISNDMHKAKEVVGSTMNSISDAVGLAQKALGLLGIGIGVHYFVELIRSTIEMEAHLDDLSKTTRLTVETLAGLAVAAKQSGSDLDGTAKLIDKLAVNMGKDAEKFAAIGIKSKDPLVAFGQLADVMNSIDDPQTRAAVGAVALGKGWEAAAPLMAEGSEKIAELIAKGKESSKVTAENAAKAKEFEDKIVALKSRASGFVVGFVDPLVSGMLKIWKVFDLVMGPVEKFFNKINFFILTPGKLLGMWADVVDVLGASSGHGASGSWGTPKKPPSKSALDNFIGNNAGAEKTAIARAQLTADIDQIRKDNAALIDNLDNAESIMKALRAAGLIDEQNAYASTDAFIKLKERVREDGLTKEIARLRQEKLDGKEAIDNAKVIAAAEAELAKVKADATAAGIINDIQAKAALQAVTQARRDAIAAQQEYLDVMTRTQARELAGIGAGAEQRSNLAARAQIEDKYSQQIAQLNKQRTSAEFFGKFDNKAQEKYDIELALIKDFQAKALATYDDYYAKRKAMEADWILGAREAMQNYYDDSQNIYKQTNDLELIRK